MHTCPACANKVIPQEYRETAERLFPPAGLPPDRGPDIQAVKDFAEILGIGADYNQILGSNISPDDIKRLLGHFQNNLDLLIQKTWVEKDDEARKEKLQDRLHPFIAVIEGGNYQKALEDFSAILEELAYLLFGAQSRKEDFAEYTFRIDTQMGLFWWYGWQIGALQKTFGASGMPGNEYLRAILLIGICYLTNF